MAEEIPTNSHCLLTSFEDAYPRISKGEFNNSEPGPYRNSIKPNLRADTSVLSHELGEWISDPQSQSATPPWGQLPFCSGVYEVGDPLNQTLMPEVKMPNGFTYHLQELAFFSWFYRISPSDGVNGWYSNNGTFMTSAGPICQ